MARNAMRPVAEVAKLIAEGKILLLAGDETLLAQLPPGNWIAGTTVLFMAEDGGTTDKERVFVTDLSDVAEGAVIKQYKSSELAYIANDYPASGFTVLIVPGGSEIHASFAKQVQSYEGVFDSALLGWVSGVDVTEIGKRQPKVFAGSSISLTNDAAVMHVSLPPGKRAHLDTINLFSPSDGDIIVFHHDGFSCDGECTINGKRGNFASYLAERKIDTQLPLIANHDGALVNVSIQSIDAMTGRVQFYAPVFSGLEYRIANPMTDYTKEFEQYLELEQCMQDAGANGTVFSCNCVLNFLHADLMGKKTGTFVGPITFGEIAYMLLNQTLVYLTITDAN